MIPVMARKQMRMKSDRNKSKVQEPRHGISIPPPDTETPKKIRLKKKSAEEALVRTKAKVGLQVRVPMEVPCEGGRGCASR